jgi:ABC-type amino acid transport system permease subunit
MTERKMKRKKKTKKQIRETTRAGVAALRERQRKAIKLLGVNSEQALVTMILKGNFTEELKQYLKEVMK